MAQRLLGLAISRIARDGGGSFLDFPFVFAHGGRGKKVERSGHFDSADDVSALSKIGPQFRTSLGSFFLPLRQRRLCAPLCR
jgi:hypothetical protein